MISWAPSDVAHERKRFAVRAPPWALWVSLSVLAVVAEALALRPLLLDRPAAIQWLDVVFSLIGGSFVAFGLIAWHRRPDSRSGKLMTATGFAFFITPLLAQIDAPLAVTTNTLFTDLWIFFFVTLILTLLTSGRLQSNRDRWLVASYAIPVAILQVVWLLFLPDENNLLEAFPDADTAHVIDRIQRGTLAVSCALTVAVVVYRWRATTPPRRRALLPSLAGALTLTFFAALLVNDLVAGTRNQTLLWFAACSLVTVPAAFLAGLLRSRLARGGLTDLFRGLGTLRGGELQAALAKSLGDRDLTVAYWLPAYETYADANGTAVTLPEPDGERAIAHVERQGRRVAALVYDASLDDDPELVEAVTAAAGIAIENEHLHAESQARLVELKASRERIVSAGDAERRRLERNLHDGAQQRLVALSMQLRLLQRRVRDDPSTEHLVTSASDELARSLAELRELARGIHPAVLEHGLAPALDALATRSPVPTTVSYEPGARLPEPVELAAYFVASEALTNVAKYACATEATVRVWRSGALANVEIADNGVGGADDSQGTGLRGLADRVEALDGRLRVISPPGAGTIVSAELPCGS